MALSNMMREGGHRTLAGQRLKGIVVDNEDPKKLNRVKIRSPLLHRNIPDDKLPWFTPATQHSSNSGGNNQGKHGPIPPKGTEVWFTFRDDSQYFGEYYGAPIHKKTAVSDFAEEEKSSAQGAGGAGGAGGLGSIGGGIGGSLSSIGKIAGSLGGGGGGIGNLVGSVTGSLGGMGGIGSVAGILTRGMSMGVAIPGLGGISARAGLGGVSFTGGLSLPGIGSLRAGGTLGPGGITGRATGTFGSINMISGAGTIVSRLTGGALASNISGIPKSIMGQAGQITGSLQSVAGLASQLGRMAGASSLAGIVGGSGVMGGMLGNVGGLAKMTSGMSGSLRGLSGNVGGMAGKVGGLGGSTGAVGAGGAGESSSVEEDYKADYPQVEGDVNPSGGRIARNHKRDVEEDTHVSGSTIKRDGKGNVEEIVNGDWENPNKEAKKKYPKGRSLHVHGDWTVFVSGGAKVHAGGDAEVVAKGKAFVHAGGDVDVAAGGNVKLSGNTITLAANTINLAAGNVRTQVPIVLGASGSKTSPKGPSGPKSALPRKRPKVEAKKDDTSY